MAKKKKPSGARKHKSRRGRGGDGGAGGGHPQKPIALEEILARAESAVEASDVDAALRLFGRAAGTLRSRVHAPAAAASGSGGDRADLGGDDDDDRRTLSAVLGKMGELKASNGDVDAARSDFLDAIELLGPAPEADAEAETAEAGAEGGTRDDDVGAARRSEGRAGLHLYLGQLSSGPEALASFRVGVRELEGAVRALERVVGAASSHDGEDGDADVDMEGGEEGVNLKRSLVETRRQLCAAHCSIAELYLTDLCEEPDAESSCEAALDAALELDGAAAASADGSGDDPNDDDNEMGPPPPDAWQTMANLRLSQSRAPEASECVLRAYDRMRVGCEALSALVGLGRDDGGDGGTAGVESEMKARELVDVEAASALPEYHFRCQTAKILLECASSLEDDAVVNRCAEAAIQVLGSLLAQDDEIVEVWYLLGCAFVACAPPNPESAHYYWENALTMLNRAKQGLEECGDCDDDGDNENELEVIECQIIDIKKKLGQYKEGDSDEDMDDS